MSTPLNPVSVENGIRGTSERISKGVLIASRRYGEFLKAVNAYERAFAREYMAYDGAAHAKKYAALLATTELKDALDVADVAYREADRQARALDSELRAWQSVGASVRSMYGVAGRGES